MSDFLDVCLNCGSACSDTYCSEACEQSEQPELSSTSSATSSVNSSPSYGYGNPSPGSQPVSVLDLGKASFDYGYHLRGSAPSQTKSASSTYTEESILRLRRTPQQLPSQPRRLSSNLLSPSLRPVRASRPTPAPLAVTTSITAQACGKPECPVRLNSDGTHGPKMIRRASAPLSAGLTMTHRGRSRERTPASNLDGRAESMHLVGASGAPICVKPEACVHAVACYPVVVRQKRYSFSPALATAAVGHEPRDDFDSDFASLNLGSPRRSDSAIVSSSSSSSSDGGELGHSHKEDTRGRGRTRPGVASRRSKSRHRETAHTLVR